MQAITYLSSVCALAIAFAGCRDAPYFCEGAPHHNCLAIDAGPKLCTGNADCTAAGAGVCDLAGTMMCVQCTVAEPIACSGTSPVCGTDHSCRGCSSHTDCPMSMACLPDGSCGTNANVAYVDPTGTDNNNCTLATPCLKVSKALATGRPYVKFHGTTDEAVTIKDRNVTVLADPGATLTRTSNGNILIVDGTSDVKIYDLAINGASGNGAGVSLPNGGTQSLTLTRVTMSGNNGMGGAIIACGGTLTVSQSTVSGNTGGGISLSGAQFDITNSIITKNGGATSPFGGLLLTLTNNGTRRFEFNTVAQNQAMTGITPGVFCAAVATSITFANSVVFDNGATIQVEGNNCIWTYSDIGPVSVAGTGNINVNPMFMNAMQNNFHLMGGSPAVDVADPGASLIDDIDGDSRPQGLRRDMGADEVRP